LKALVGDEVDGEGSGTSDREGKKNHLGEKGLNDPAGLRKGKKPNCRGMESGAQVCSRGGSVGGGNAGATEAPVHKPKEFGVKGARGALKEREREGPCKFNPCGRFT